MVLSMSRTQWWAGGITVSLVLLTLLAPLPAMGAPPQERHITISARSFAFEPGTVRVNRGDTVIVNLESTDVVHGLYVDGYGVATQAEPGRPGQAHLSSPTGAEPSASAAMWRAATCTRS